MKWTNTKVLPQPKAHPSFFALGFTYTLRTKRAHDSQVTITQKAFLLESLICRTGTRNLPVSTFGLDTLDTLFPSSSFGFTEEM